MAAEPEQGERGDDLTPRSITTFSVLHIENVLSYVSWEGLVMRLVVGDIMVYEMTL